MRLLITGASSGLGLALARALAAPGAELHLSGRDAARLEQAAEACRALGAVVRPMVLDVRDAAAMAAWVRSAGPLDLVIANAGISAGTGGSAGPGVPAGSGVSAGPGVPAESGAAPGLGEPPGQIRAIFATNLDGMLNTVLPALAVMAGQPPGADGVRGRIAVVASIAAFLAHPGAPSYCAAKAAADAWVVATAASARRQGIVLSSVCPGFVRTPMTAVNRFPMPGLMAPEHAAAIILRGVAAGHRRIAFPWWLAGGARLAGLLPPALLARLLAGAPAKPGLG